MKKVSIIIPILLLLFVLILIGIYLFPELPLLSDTTENTHYIENAALLYKDAIKGLSEQDLQIAFSEKRNVTTSKVSFQVQRSATVRYDRSSLKSPGYHLSDKMTIGSHSISWEEYKIADQQYMIISGIGFQNAGPGLSTSHFSTTPIESLDPDRYGKITAIETQSEYHLEFSEATGLESWFPVGSYQIESITAHATLSKNNNRLSYTYAVVLQDAYIRTEVSYDVVVEPVAVTINLPQLDGGWLPLTEPTSPLLLEMSAGLLVQANSISSEYHEDIYFEALGDRRVRDISLQLHSTDPLSAQIKTITTTTKDSRLDQPEVTTKEEIFQDGKYTIVRDAEESSFDPSIDNDSMTRYLQNQLISTIMLSQYIAKCESETVGSVIRFNFTGTDAFAEFLCHNGGQQLYGNSDLLVGETVSVKTEQLSCYLELERSTSLPVGSGICYEGSYEIQGLPYRFTYEATQSYQYHTN